MYKHLKHLLLATRYSLQGLSAAVRKEMAFQQELVLLVIAIPTALYIGESALQRALLIVSLLWVMSVELLNSAIESAVDHTSKEQHKLAGLAKDYGSAAVMLALISCAGIWGAVLVDNYT